MVSGMTDRSAGKWAWPLVGALCCLALGIASGLSTVGGNNAWYRELAKPPGTPPPWVFGPVWSVLYLLMGVTLGRLIHRREWPAVWVFGIQFALNLGWTPVFFGANQIATAFAIISALWLGVFSTILLAWKADKAAAWLLAPYLVWVSYATYLNAGIFRLN